MLYSSMAMDETDAVCGQLMTAVMQFWMVPVRYSEEPLFRKSIFTAVIYDTVRVKFSNGLSE